MDLPFIFIEATWHIGQPSPDGRLHKRFEKGWDFEFGLLSVSLDPEAWRSGWAEADGVIYEITASGRPLCFLDADNSLVNHRNKIEAAAVQAHLLRRDESGINATGQLYLALDLTPDTQLHLQTRPFEDQLLQAALAVLASKDEMIDGLWWPDTLNGEMRTERGGIYQHRLAELAIAAVPSVCLAPNPCALELPSAILD